MGKRIDVLLLPVKCFNRPIEESCRGPTMSSSLRRSIETALIIPVSPTICRFLTARAIANVNLSLSMSEEKGREGKKNAPGIAKCLNKLTTPNRICVVSPGLPLSPGAATDCSTRSRTIRARGAARP
jgi:hypothetical protein